MTESQKKAIAIIKKELEAQGIDANSAYEKNFINAIKAAKIRAPWKILNQYRQPGDVFHFQELFDKAGVNLVEMPESFPVSIKPADNSEETSNDTDPDAQSIPDEVPEDSDTKVRKKVKKQQAAKPKVFKDPVFLVESADSSEEMHVVGIARSFRNAYEKLVYRAIHAVPSIDEETARKEIDKKGFVILKSAQINRLWCVISKQELI